MNSEVTPLLPLGHLQSTGISQLETAFHIVCVVAGTGLLQIPFALSQMGWLGIVVLFFLAIVNFYTANLLISCLEGEGLELASFPEIGRKLWGSVGFYCVSFFYGTAMAGSVCLYLILAGLNFESLVGNLCQTQWIAVLTLVLAIPLIGVKSLKEVGFVSLLGAITAIAVVFIIVGLSISDYSNYKPLVEHRILELRAFGSVLGTLCFSYGGNYVYPEIYHGMAEKTKFKKVLGAAIVFITTLYLLTGVFGYLTYGNYAVSPVLLNLPKGAWKTLSLILITLHVIFACPIMLQTICSDVERAFDIKADSSRNLVRLTVLGFIGTVSATLPFFADLMSLIGAVSNTMLIFVLPIVFNLNLKPERKTSTVIIGFLIMAIGIFGGALGTFDALNALYHDIGAVMGKKASL